MEIIRSWYNGNRDYKVGVALFLQYGKDERLKAYFKNGMTEFSQQKLAEELKAMFLSETEPPSPESQYSLPPNLFSTDSIIEELYRNKSALHKKKDLLRHSLESMSSDAERGRAAHIILAIRQEIENVWELERYYKDHGKLPEEDAGVTDPKMLQHRRHQVNTNIRRLRFQLKKRPIESKLSTKP